MNYYTSAFPIFASTSGIAYEVYLSGCRQKCRGCHSDWTHAFDAGIELNEEMMNKLLDDIDSKRDLMDNICILGGEPMDQDRDEFLDFLDQLDERFPDKQIWMYTSYAYEDVPQNVLDRLNHIKCGFFSINELNPDDKKGWYHEDYNLYLISRNQYFRGGNRSRGGGQSL